MREQLKKRLQRSRSRRKRWKSKRRVPFWLIIFVILLGYLIPDPAVIPVQNATRDNWDSESFWYYPWGTSITHKGIDIFSDHGTPVISDGYGIVTFVGTYAKGGKVVLVLGPKWKMHYYAHMSEQKVNTFQFLKPGDVIGLHYTVRTIIPYPWRYARGPHGSKKMFYLDPGERYP